MAVNRSVGLASRITGQGDGFNVWGVVGCKLLVLTYSQLPIQLGSEKKSGLKVWNMVGIWSE
jgi:hypothetical protein